MAKAYERQRVTHDALGSWLGWAVVVALAAATWLSLPATDMAAPVTQHRLVPTHAVAAVPFALCTGPKQDDCVVDGDTFRMGGTRIRIADIDTPETHPARCAREALLGRRATMRLQALLNAGPFVLVSIDRDTDRYGRVLRIVARDGRSIMAELIAQGLARPYAGGHRDGWCARAVSGS